VSRSAQKRNDKPLADACPAEIQEDANLWRSVLLQNGKALFSGLCHSLYLQLYLGCFPDEPIELVICYLTDRSGCLLGQRLLS